MRDLLKSSWNRLFLSFVALTVLVGCAAPRQTSAQRFEYQQAQMGLPFRIVLYARDASQAQKASDAAFARISELNSILSDYDEESELSKLSRTSGTGSNVVVSQDLWRVLEKSQEFAQESRGAFDITVGPAVSLWRKARRDKRFPDPTRLAEARKAIGYKNLVLNGKNHTALLTVPHMRLDLGAIAKGYAVDEALKVLKDQGIRSALVSGGGDMAMSDAPPGKAGWKVELPAERDSAATSEFLLLKNEAMATSGDLFQFVELDGKRYSHIVDPRTGIGLVNQSRVVVIARNCTTADALSTTISVLGKGESERLAKRFSARKIQITEPTQ